jgi:hypothetical protein
MRQSLPFFGSGGMVDFVDGSLGKAGQQGAQQKRSQPLVFLIISPLEIDREAGTVNPRSVCIFLNSAVDDISTGSFSEGR